MQNRRKFLSQTALAAGAVTILKPIKGFAFFENSGVKNSNVLTILHTGNLNAATTSSENMGGLQAVLKVISDSKKQTGNVLLLDSGDFINGKNNHSNKEFLNAINAAGYDALTPGSNELNNGLEFLNELKAQSKAPVIATNYKNDAISDVTLPFHIIKKGSIKIGIISVANTSKVKGVVSNSLGKTVSMINSTASFLKKNHNCTLNVCMMHEGFSIENCNVTDDLQFACKTVNVDVFVSGSSSNSLYNTHVIKNMIGDEVIVSNAGNKGKLLGRIDITFNDLNQKIGVETKQVIITTEKNKNVALRNYAASLNLA